jgi:hypothetical protein
MASKSKNNKSPKTDYRARQRRTTQIVIIIVSVVLILSWTLSLIVK